MDNLRERTLSFLIKSNQLLGLSTESIEKSWKELQEQNPDGEWITIRGRRVFVDKDGKPLNIDLVSKKDKQSSLKEKLGLRYEPEQLSTRESAFRYASKKIKPHEVILGDNDKFWVVTMSDAQKLIKLGYERAL